MDDSKPYQVSIDLDADREGHLVISARLTSGEEWIKFAETINRASAQLWPAAVGESEDSGPRRRTYERPKGEPREGTFDAQVLDFARRTLADTGGLPEVVEIADHMDRHTFNVVVAIGRLKKRGVWPEEGGAS